MAHDPYSMRDVPEDWKIGLAYGDTHCPFVRPEAEDWLCDVVKRWSPDFIVHGGDGIEATFASRWPSELQETAEDEFNALARHLGRVCRANGNAQCSYHYLFGNHDDNSVGPCRVDKRVRSLADMRTHEILREAWATWNLHDTYEYSQRGVIRFGQVTVAHGYEISSVSGRNQALRLGFPYGLFISGHTHRPEPVTKVRITQDVHAPYWHANWGTLGPLRPEYVKRQFHDNWGAAAVLFAFDPNMSLRKAYRVNWKAELLRYDS